MPQKKIQIKSIDGNILFEYSCENNNIKTTLEKAIEEGSNLSRSNLSGSDLTGSNLTGSNLRGSNLSGSDLRWSNLTGSDLRWSDLRWSDLRWSNLSGSTLRWSNLTGSDLSQSDLRRSNLSGSTLNGSKNIPQFYRYDLNILRAQKGKLIAYKYLNGNKSPYQNTEYKIGKEYEEKDCDYDEKIDCGKGINVASLEWCLRNTSGDCDKTYIEVEFDVNDIVAIPYFTDGKFRVKKIKVLRKLTKKELKKACESIK